MSTTQLDRSRSPTMPCILLVGERERANLVAAIFIITGASHTVIPIQHAHKIATSETPDAKVETERGVPHSLRRQRKIVAALKLPRPESVQPEIEERGGRKRGGKGHTRR